MIELERYSKAVAITPNDSVDLATRADAIYVGSGNWTEDTTAAQLSDPVFWLRADKGVIGTSSVSAWADQSGNGNDAANVALQNPVLSTSETLINNQAAVDFQSGDAMKVDDNNDHDFDGAFEIMVLVKFDSLGTYQAIISKDSDDSIWNLKKDNDQTIIFKANGADPATTSTVSADTWYLVGVSRTALNSIQMYLDGVADGSPVSNSTDFTTSDDMYIGKRNAGTERHLDGQIAEIIMWDKKLNTDQYAYATWYMDNRYLRGDVEHNFVDVKMTLDGDVVVQRLKRGEVHKLAPTRIWAADTNGADIIALNE